MDAHPRVRVLRGWELSTVTDGESGVVAHARRTPDVAGGEPGPGSLTVTGLYLVGCDGAGSTVRETFDSAVEDLDCSSDWLVLDLVPHFDITVDPTFGQFLPPPRSITVAISGNGRRRWEFLRNPDETIDDLSKPEFAWGQLARWGVTPENSTLERQAVYTFHALWARNWHHGRVVIAGDAAHLMPPFLGEGMNSGVRDAMTLSWQLDLILRGLADPATLLDSYSSERSFHVRQLTEVAVHIAKDFTEMDPQRAQERDDRLRAERDGRVAKEPLPNWRLGAGTWDPDDDHAGFLGVQGKVELRGTIGRFDDMVDRRRFVLMSRHEDPTPHLSESVLARWAEIGGVIAHFGPGSPLSDVDGTYDSWFTGLGVELAVFRPDFYVAATATSADQAPRLVTELLDRLGVRT